jgi:hypothetical protein
MNMIHRLMIEAERREDPWLPNPDVGYCAVRGHKTIVERVKFEQRMELQCTGDNFAGIAQHHFLMGPNYEPSCEYTDRFDPAYEPAFYGDEIAEGVAK